MSVKVDRELCTKCGICIERCPLDCLYPDIEGYPEFSYNDCWYCGVCECDCPTGAARIELPYLIR